MTKPTTVATPHTKVATGGPAAGATRAGSLIWWRFQDSFGELSELAGFAKAAKLSPLFLPLPHPVSQQVAFSRMVRAGTRVFRRPGRAGHAPEQERWLCQPVDEREQLAAEVRKWFRRQAKEPSLIAEALRFEPVARRPRPWRVRLSVRLRDHDGAAYLPTSEVVEILMLVSVPKRRDQSLDITASAKKLAAGADRELAADPRKLAAESRAVAAEVSDLWPAVPAAGLAGIRGCLRMAAHLYRVLDRERTLASSSEIGAGVMDALDVVGGVKLRPGLYTVPGDDGIVRAERVLAYLRQVPGCEAGMFDLYRRRYYSELAGLILPAVEQRIAELLAEIEELDVDEVGVGALRNLSRLVEAEAERVKRNRRLLPRDHARELRRSLGEARVQLRQKKELKERRTGREIALGPEPRAAAERHLDAGLAQLLALAGLGDAKELPGAVSELRLGGGAGRMLSCVLLLRRLIRLSEAVDHAAKSRVYRRSTARLKVLFDALLQGTRDFRSSCLADRRAAG